MRDTEIWKPIPGYGGLYDVSRLVGSRVKHSKVTEGQVIEMRQRYATGNVTQLELACEYGFKSRAAIGAILQGKRWAHVQ